MREIRYGGLAFTLLGIGSSSALVYTILFGGDGLLYARRLMVYASGLRIYYLYIAFGLIVRLYSMKSMIIGYKDFKKAIIYSCEGVVLLIGLIAINQGTLSHYGEMIKQREDSLDNQNVIELVDEIRKLPQDVVIYTNGWAHAPDISLLAGRRFEDYSFCAEFLKLDMNQNRKNAYFVIGNGTSNPSGWNDSYEKWVEQCVGASKIFQSSQAENEFEKGTYYYSLYKLN